MFFSFLLSLALDLAEVSKGCPPQTPFKSVLVIALGNQVARTGSIPLLAAYARFAHWATDDSVSLLISDSDALKPIREEYDRQGRWLDKWMVRPHAERLWKLPHCAP
jgi:hypothetical protein